MPHNSTIDYKKINTEIILNSFKSLGINAEASGRNDILVEGKKVIKKNIIFSIRSQEVLLKLILEIKDSLQNLFIMELLC